MKNHAVTGYHDDHDEKEFEKKPHIPSGTVTLQDGGQNGRGIFHNTTPENVCINGKSTDLHAIACRIDAPLISSARFRESEPGAMMFHFETAAYQGCIQWPSDTTTIPSVQHPRWSLGSNRYC